MATKVYTRKETYKIMLAQASSALRKAKRIPKSVRADASVKNFLGDFAALLVLFSYVDDDFQLHYDETGYQKKL
jgi:hypothetical protein